MAKEITFLHLSDFHAKTSQELALRDRAQALCRDLAREMVQPDVILITGDLSFSGKEPEFKLCQQVLIEPLLRQLQLSSKNVFVVPGNHDVDRLLVNSYEESGLRKALKADEDAEFALKSNESSTKRLEAFYAFANANFENHTPPFHARSVWVKGIELGFACFNSAWRCAGDNDKGKLFLTVQQVNTLAEKLENCALRFALLHHPFDWYHKEDQTALDDLKRRFEVCLSGHLHQPISVGEQTTSYNSLILTVPALFEPKFGGEGFNIYSLNIEDRTLRAEFRRYVRKRDEFDRDTTHARNGEHIFSLPIQNLAKLTKGLMVQRLSACRSTLQKQIQKQLQSIQNVPNPVFVTPRISRVYWIKGAKARAPLQGSLVDIASKSCLIYGGRESGKTILLQTITADVNEACEKHMTAGFYIDFEDKTNFRDSGQISKFIETELEKQYSGELPNSVIIFADNFCPKTLESLNLLATVVKERRWVLVLAVSNQLIFESLQEAEAFKDYEVFELSHWGPSRIREFVVKYFQDTSTDVDAAYSFVTASLKDTDLPATPWVVSLYLSIFPTLGKQVSSLSFLRLLEKIEESRLGRFETSSSDSLYNKREILARLAWKCFVSKSIECDESELLNLIRSYFETKLLPVDPSTFIESLQESGFIAIKGQRVSFSYYIFYDYFLARAFEKGIGDIKATIVSFDNCLAISQALTLYGGLLRDNQYVAEAVLNHVAAAFPDTRDFTLSDLDKYINNSLLASKGDETADEIVTSDLKKKISYESFDDDFDRQRETQTKARATGKDLQTPDKMQQLLVAADALKMFYNVFRNLENISGQSKIAYLDKVLDFHINVNLRLIDFFKQLRSDRVPAEKKSDLTFQAISAYLVTMSGQVFLANNIGNQSLQDAILKALAETANDFKRLLLVCLYGDLRLPGYQRQLQDFVADSESLVAVELIYLQIRYLLITHESLQVPAGLVSAFHAAFQKRHALVGERKDPGGPSRAYSAEITEATRAHLDFFNAKEALLRTSNYS